MKLLNSLRTNSMLMLISIILFCVSIVCIAQAYVALRRNTRLTTLVETKDKEIKELTLRLEDLDADYKLCQHNFKSLEDELYYIINGERGN